MDKSDYKYVGFKQIDGWNITCRNDNWNDLVLDIERAEKGILNIKTQEEQDIEEVITPKTKICPICGSALIRGETKTGKPFEKCSTNKWDRDLKKAIGCPFVNWEI